MIPVAHTIIYTLSGVTTFIACCLSLALVYAHWVNWADPVAQNHTVRIILLAPLYALCSLASLLWPRYFVYFNGVCELYEAYVLYQFFLLLLHCFAKRVTYIDYFGDGAEREIDRKKEIPFEERGRVTEAVQEARTRNYFEACRPVEVCGYVLVEPTVTLLQRLHWIVAQYGPARLIYTLLVIGLYETDAYAHRSLSPAGAHFWMTGLINLSITLAVGGVLLFIVLVKQVIWQHDPVLKFGSLKLVIFFVFWQSVLFTALASGEVLPVVYFAPWNTTETVDALDNTVVCVEMALLALYHIWIFRSDETRRTSTLWSLLQQSA